MKSIILASCVFLLSLLGSARAASRIEALPVPAEMRSNFFTVTVNGQVVDVAHAASNYDFASFDMSAPVEVAITASDPAFWRKGVSVEPWRLGIRPERNGATIRFKLSSPAKLSIGLPGDYLNYARLLFLFAGHPQTEPHDATTRIIPPGIHRESLNPKSGEQIYLAPGAFVLGSLNLWRVHDVKISGRGVILYDGPQNPNTDEGWQQRPDWHCIGALESHNIQISGLTCVVRSRTWQIQMKDSSGFLYDDIRVIGGNEGNANQDGMDWLGSSDTVVRNSFFRASDDVFAMQGNWDGYKDSDLLRPGRDVENITIENSVLSTSISNIVRAGWPKKIYNSRNFTLRNSDIIHSGIGACGQSFGLIGFWGAQNAQGHHENYRFENLFLDNWYSLAQLEQQQPGLRNFTFRNIWAIDSPSKVPSTMTGSVADLRIENLKIGQHRVADNADLPILVSNGAEQPQYQSPSGPIAAFTLNTPYVETDREAEFIAAPVEGGRYHWYFGDGTEATGRKVRHRYTDAEGTERDATTGAGRFRVLLNVTDREGHEDWAAESLAVIGTWHDAAHPIEPVEGGLTWALYPYPGSTLPNLNTATPQFLGQSSALQSDPQGFTHYAVRWEGFLDIPADGGYNFHLLARDGARLLIDGYPIAETGAPFAQVCGAPGNAVRYARNVMGLRSGLHHIRIEWLHDRSDETPRILWEGPSLRLSEIPAAAYRRSHQDGIHR